MEPALSETAWKMSKYGVFWSVFSRICTEYGEILRSISPYSVKMRENTDQKNSAFGHFSRSERFLWSQHCSSFCNTVFSGLAYYFFLSFLHEVRIQETLKNDATLFLRYIYFAKIEVTGPFLFPKSTLLNRFLNLFIRFFWDYTQWQALKSGLEWLLWISKKATKL